MATFPNFMLFLFFAGGGVLLYYGIDRSLNDRNKKSGEPINIFNIFMMILGAALFLTSVVTFSKQKMNF